MPAHEFIVRYREYRKIPGTWKEDLFCLGDWPFDDSLPDEKNEHQPEKSPMRFSVQFCLRYVSGTSYDELRAFAKKQSREALRQHYPEAKIY